ncbi:MAG: DUF3616 domain-containing protein [Deltaproteobacteria bacterium]|nr:MAG: DUF3616 domain-containing protein [Deltaproteobacteria bacterium]
MKPMLVALLISCTRAGASPESVQFVGECDGSAAVVVEDTLYIGVDEGTSLLAYALPKGKESRLAPTDRIDLATLIERAGDRSLKTTKKGVPRELDLEAAARGGDRLWWLGGHGRSKKGKLRPNRRVLFATSVGAPSTLEVIVSPEDLMPRILKLPTLGPRVAEAESRDRPPKKGGLNIEGLAVHPESGDLLLGLRSPLTQDQRAWILRLTPQGELHEHAQIDLAGLGVRSLTWSENAKTFLIAAGSTGSGGPFKLYRWDGQDEVTPIAYDLGELRPEGLTDVPGGVLLVSDDSGVRRDGVDCKNRRAADPHDPLVYFEGRVLPLQALK